MNINKISSGNKNDKVILSDGRECLIKQTIEKQTLENGDIIWKIFMKDNNYFIIDNISINNLLLHPNIWYISNSKYIVSRNEGKTINLNQLLLPKNNSKELYIHKDGDNFNFRISNILLTNQSVVNSKIIIKKDIIIKKNNTLLANSGTELGNTLLANSGTELGNTLLSIASVLDNKIDENNEDNEDNEDNKTSKVIEDTKDLNIDTQYKLYDKLQYKIIDTKDNYIILENKDKSDDKIIEMTAKNNSNIKFIFDIKMLDKALKISWLYHSGTGYICNNTSKRNLQSNIDRNDMLYFHSFIYFLENPDLEKQKGYSIHHKNINKLDNRIVNLDYVNQSIQNAIRDNPKRITIQPNIQNIKEDLPKLTTYYPAKGEFGEYLEIDIKPMKNETIQFERIRKKTTKSKNCTLLDKVCHSIIIRYQIIHNLLTSNKKISLTRFCLEGKQFLNLIQIKKHHEHLINSIQDKYNEETINNNYTITFFEKYIKEKSKKKANSGSFKPIQISIESS